MQFNFPKPKTLISLQLLLDTEICQGMEKLANEKGITTDQIIETILSTGWYSAFPSRENPIKKDQPVSIGNIKAETRPTEEKMPVEAMEKTKQCLGKCGLRKTLDEFYNEKKWPDGKSKYCKPCWKEIYCHQTAQQKSEYQKEYFQKNKDDLAAKKRERRHKQELTPEQKTQKSAYMKDYRKRKLEEVIPAALQVEEKKTEPEKIIKLTAKQKIDNSKIREDEHIKDSILICDNLACPKPYRKFMKGMGEKHVTPGGIYNFCSFSCKEIFIGLHPEMEKVYAV